MKIEFTKKGCEKSGALEVTGVIVTIDGNEYRITEDQVRKCLEVTKTFSEVNDTAMSVSPRYSNQIGIK